MSGSNCGFLTTFFRRRVRWSDIPICWRIFKFVVIHTVRVFSRVNEAEVDVFLEFLCIFCESKMLAIWSLVPLAFLKPAWISGSSRFKYCWSLAWRILSITLLSCVMRVWAFFGIAFLWDWNENWPFPTCGHCWVFHICWHIECSSTLTASSFRIWNSSTEILSPPLALFVVMLPKTHLTSHSKMSGSSESLTAPLWLSGSLRPFLYRSSWVFLPPLGSRSLLPLLDPCRFCPLLCLCLYEIFPWYLQFSWKNL